MNKAITFGLGLFAGVAITFFFSLRAQLGNEVELSRLNGIISVLSNHCPAEIEKAGLKLKK